jgi:BMFP domain-containing protein YqiC
MFGDVMEHWRDLYAAAILEVDSKKLQECIEKAEHAIEQRSASLNGEIPSDERLAMQDALASLRVLRRERQEVS